MRLKKSPIGILLLIGLLAFNGCSAVPAAPSIPGAPNLPDIPDAGEAAPNGINISLPSEPCCPHPSIWDFLGLPQLARGVGGLVGLARRFINRNGNFPGAEGAPPTLAIGDPANLESDNPAIAAAAKAKQEEDAKAQKIIAIKYLASQGCECYPDNQDALLASLDDCDPEIRYQAAKAFITTAKAECPYCNAGNCCGEKVVKKLREIVYEMKPNGCYKDPSPLVRATARRALESCLGYGCCEGEEGPGTPPPPPIEGPTEELEGQVARRKRSKPAAGTVAVKQGSGVFYLPKISIFAPIQSKEVDPANAPKPMLAKKDLANESIPEKADAKQPYYEPVVKTEKMQRMTHPSGNFAPESKPSTHQVSNGNQPWVQPETPNPAVKQVPFLQTPFEQRHQGGAPKSVHQPNPGSAQPNTNRANSNQPNSGQQRPSRVPSQPVLRTPNHGTPQQHHNVASRPNDWLAPHREFTPTTHIQPNTGLPRQNWPNVPVLQAHKSAPQQGSPIALQHFVPSPDHPDARRNAPVMGQPPYQSGPQPPVRLSYPQPAQNGNNAQASRPQATLQIPNGTFPNGDVPNGNGPNASEETPRLKLEIKPTPELDIQPANPPTWQHTVPPKSMTIREGKILQVDRLRRVVKIVVPPHQEPVVGTTVDVYRIYKGHVSHAGEFSVVHSQKGHVLAIPTGQVDMEHINAQDQVIYNAAPSEPGIEYAERPGVEKQRF